MIGTRYQFGESSSQAIENLFTNTTTLHAVFLRHYCFDEEGNNKLNVENILQGMKQNTTIKSMTLENAIYGDLMFSRLFDALHSNHTLEYLFLEILEYSGSTSRGKQDLGQAVQMDRLSRPIKLVLRSESVFNNVQEIEQLLRSHPEIRLEPTGWQYERRRKRKVPTLLHCIDLNLYGRYLLDNRNNNIPLSLWPIVLENALEKADDGPSIVFEFLKGPGFAARF